MNKADIAGRLAGSTELGKARAAGAVEAVFVAIGEALDEGAVVRVAGFGTFAVKNRPARAGRNPRTGEAVSIPRWCCFPLYLVGSVRDLPGLFR